MSLICPFNALFQPVEHTLRVSIKQYLHKKLSTPLAAFYSFAKPFFYQLKWFIH